MFIFVLATVLAAGNSVFAQAIAFADINEIVLDMNGGFCANCERVATWRGDGTATYHEN